MTLRTLKKEVLALLRAEDFWESTDALYRFRARQVVNPLFSLFCHADAIIRWRAVSAMGAVVARLADEEVESARVVMRRFLWTLNDESGGIGWGSPEAMGDIMARHSQMASEYACMLISYADPCGNYLEHPVLQRGVIWALGRLGHQRPEMVRPTAKLLIPWLQSTDAIHRGLAVWAAQPLESDLLADHLSLLINDDNHISIYMDGHLSEHRIGSLVHTALETITVSRY